MSKCPTCGQEAATRACPACARHNWATASYCAFCGARLPESAAVEDHDDPLADRVLCPDGACIGIIGEDGACTECGTRPEQYQEENPPQE